jgi:hypothetical protein
MNYFLFFRDGVTLISRKFYKSIHLRRVCFIKPKFIFLMKKIVLYKESEETNKIIELKKNLNGSLLKFFMMLILQ